MVLGWRRAFCTSIPRDRKEKKQEDGSGFGFFSNPSTPRLRDEIPGLRCKTTASVAVETTESAPVSPKLKCKTKYSSGFFSRSNPSSPRSPSTFSLLKSSLRLTKNRCGICLQNVKSGQGMAIFTAECSHNFHFPCISSHMKKQGSSLVCPVCSVTWKQMPLLSAHCNPKKQKPSTKPPVEAPKRELPLPSVANVKPVMLKVYNDDEPLMSPTAGARFNPIPESDEENDTGADEFQGFFVNANANTPPRVVNTRNVDLKVSPEVAVVAVGRSYETHAVVLKIRAPAVHLKSASRAPIDLVAVIDVSRSMNNEKLQMMKKSMRLIVSSLSNSDRLSIVAFSTNSKRLLSLRRMTTDGRRAARRIIEAVALLDGASTSNDALKKASKVLEDRREKNTAASIILFSDDHSRSRRFTETEIPIHSIDLNQSSCESVSNLISVVIQDLKLSLGFLPGSRSEISGVYSNVDRPVTLGSGLIRIGDLYAEEERELLIEVKVPSTAIITQQILTVRSSYKDPSTQQVIQIQDQALAIPRAVRSTHPSIQRLKSVFIATRAVAESRFLINRNDLNGAERMLSSAKALLLQSGSEPAQDFARRLETELLELNRTRGRSTTPTRSRELIYIDEKGEPLTPTSAWRAAERLAKVAMMRKSLNRVSDLHGFEDARF